MANELRANETQKDFLERLTSENARKPFEEFPKWLYHPDGRSELVNTAAEQTKLGGEWLEKPQEAIDVREGRDKRDSDAFIAKTNAEAKAKAK